MSQPLRLLDLFSGIGGFSYAAEHLVGGFQTVQFVEREPFCQQILRRHWPEVPIHDDICTFSPAVGSADVVCGGFPCQDISKAGHQEGIQIHTRSGLFHELMRIVRLVRPGFVVLENVTAITSNGLGIVLGELAEAGFDAEWACIPASDLGACHHRDRWWLVAHTNSHGLERKERCRAHRAPWTQTPIGCLDPTWGGYRSKPLLCGRDARVPHRVDRLKALGNAVVPQVAAIPLARVLELHRVYSDVV